MFCLGNVERPFAKRHIDLKPEQESSFVYRISLHSALLPLSQSLTPLFKICDVLTLSIDILL